jgi:tagaturonate reductase
MKPVQLLEGIYSGERNGELYPIRCDSAAYFAEKWEGTESVSVLVQKVLSDESLWGFDLTSLPGFSKAVTENLELLSKEETITN